MFVVVLFLQLSEGGLNKIINNNRLLLSVYHSMKKINIV